MASKPTSIISIIISSHTLTTTVSVTHLYNHCHQNPASHNIHLYTGCSPLDQHLVYSYTGRSSPSRDTSED